MLIIISENKKNWHKIILLKKRKNWIFFKNFNKLVQNFFKKLSKIFKTFFEYL